MKEKLTEVVDIIRSDPDVASAAAFTGGAGGGGATTNTGRMFITLKPFDKRKASVGQVMARLRKKLAQVPGAPTYLQPVQDLRIGGRLGAALYQYTLQGEESNGAQCMGSAYAPADARITSAGRCKQ